jgi:beta-N-acetylhexosaminidase
MGFDGVLIADDISMKALGGALDDRVRQTMAAGMDLTMICNASFDDRVKALNATPKVAKTAADRLMRAEAARKAAQRLTPADRQVLKQELDRLMQQKNVA